MVIKIDLAKVVNAPILSVYNYFSNVEELPMRHPNHVKNIKIVSREETGLVFEQESSLIGKKIRSTNKVVLYPDQNRIELSFLDNDQCYPSTCCRAVIFKLFWEVITIL